MSPSRSKTMRRPSGLTSTFIHVPSEVSNASFSAGPRSAVTSHFLASGCSPAVASAEVGWARGNRSEEHTSELQSLRHLVCRLLLESLGTPSQLHSFPTRRSSDLAEQVEDDAAAVRADVDVHPCAFRGVERQLLGGPEVGGDVPLLGLRLLPRRSFG